MIDNVANSIISTNSRTWVFTFFIETGFRTIAIRILRAFWSTNGVRISIIFRNTRAWACTIFLFANCICTTRIWWTRSDWFDWNIHWQRKKINTFQKNFCRCKLHGTGTHWVKGSPVYCNAHWQIPRWCITVHSALIPHSPKHGLLHLKLMHARFVGHSEFWTHSGLQFGGEPT